MFFYVILGLILLVLWLLFFGWLVTLVVGWFGVTLALWQGMIIATVLSLIGGGSAAS